MADEIMTTDERRRRAYQLLARITPSRPVWVGDDGVFRLGHSADMTEMLERLGHRTVAA